MEYKFNDIEKKWQDTWNKAEVYKVSNDSPKPKYYVLDMFPYPSGAGLHVGHPLGYMASDIYARYKRLKGFNVLHPMGYDAFGLPAEQYAIEHGIHPAVSTEDNINNFRKQLDKIGFCFDWDREVKTSDPHYYKWTQWIFLQLFDSFYNRQTNKAERIAVLIAAFEKEGNATHVCPGDNSIVFSASEWNVYDEKRQQEILMHYRLSYCGYGEVNWCEALGTVLANDEVVNGVSERGGYPVERKRLRQWYLRITEYADRLLEGLERIDFSDAMKEMQSNWIGKSSGAEILFRLTPNPSSDGKVLGDEASLKVYTTRPDTIFGVDFMVISPEHELIEKITTVDQRAAVDEYIVYVKSRSDRERMAEKKITGVFTGAFALNPFNAKEIPVWISEYVLAGYGTGAIMAVPCGDERDFKFAQHFGIPVTNIIGSHFNGEEANATKDAVLENSDFINGMVMRDAIEIVIKRIEEEGIGVRKTNYKMRDAAFSRQRYWGEPFPIVWKDGIANPLPENELPILLPYMEELKPGADAEGPLSNLTEWKNYDEGIREVNTMPGYAGSSWYFLRYMDPENEKEFCGRKVSDYWGQVDLYIGGTEHAVGHLLYSRMWTKALYDLNYIGHDEPYKKLVNQGMIQGSSRYVYRLNIDYLIDIDIYNDKAHPFFVSQNLVDRIKKEGLNQKEINYLVEDYESLNNLSTQPYLIGISEIHVDINFVDGVELEIDKIRKWKNDFKDAYFICEDGSLNKGDGTSEKSKYVCGVEIEKMSKRYFNTVDPSDLCNKYGADTFRMYEMFLGPVEQSKPWDTKGIEGVHRFLRKLWRLFYDDIKGKVWNEEKATDAEWKILHKAIKKIEDDTERFSFNTAVSAFMVCVNELSDAKCNKREVLEPLLILLTPYAPHIAEELWHLLGNETFILDAAYPVLNEKYLIESVKEYPVSINGKLRTTIVLPLSASQVDIEPVVLANEVVQKWLDGKPHKKFIYVPNKMINVVV